MPDVTPSRNPLRVPHGISGLLLIALCWPLNWLLPEAGRPAAYFFFPLWVGYALVVDFWQHVSPSRHVETLGWPMEQATKTLVLHR